MVKGQIVPQDERSRESCLHCEINDLVQKDVEGQEKVDTADLAANLEEAGTWYYVVDCATCKAVIPFKHAPEDEPILRFPTMTVRCFHCHRGHRYAPDLISHRKAAPPRRILQRASDADGDQEASRDRQEDRGIGTSEEPVIVEREADCLSSALRRANILIAAVGGKKAKIFFLSSCFFAAGGVSQLALDILYPAPLAILNELRSSGPAMILGTVFFGTILLGLALFLFGLSSFLVETFGYRLIKGEFGRIASYIANLTVQATSTVALFLIEMWPRNLPTRELPGALAALRVELGRKGQRALKRAGRSGAFEPMPFEQALSPEDEPKSSTGSKTPLPLRRWRLGALKSLYTKRE
jgi:hypothetical protein